jgi:hypothetical protein
MGLRRKPRLETEQKILGMGRQIHRLHMQDMKAPAAKAEMLCMEAWGLLLQDVCSWIIGKRVTRCVVVNDINVSDAG